MKYIMAENYEYTRNPCISHGEKCTEKLNISVLALEAEQVPQNWCLYRKNVIFVVDVSASMIHTMNSLKASILTFRDLICGKKNESVTDEEFSTTLPNFHIITFSNEATLKWSNSREKVRDSSFDDFVNSLEVEGSTNMGAAVELAFSLCPKTPTGSDALANWIVVLTDGDSNEGKYQTTDAFVDLEKKKPFNTKIITLGYGMDFEVSTLEALGDFTHLQDEESIPKFVGALVHEISTCGIIDVNIKLERTENRTILFGSLNVGWLFNERKYYFGFVPEWEHPYTGELAGVYYKQITKDGIYSFFYGGIRASNDKPSKSLTPEIVSKIYSFRASKLIKDLYSVDKRQLETMITKVLLEVGEWKGEGTEEARETVRRICRDIQKSYRNSEFSSFQIAGTLQKQSAYMGGLFQTPSSISSVKRACELAKTYM